MHAGRNKGVCTRGPQRPALAPGGDPQTRAECTRMAVAVDPHAHICMHTQSVIVDGALGKEPPPVDKQCQYLEASEKYSRGQRKHRMRLLGSLALLAFLMAIAACAMAILAWDQREEAEKHAQTAEENKLQAEACAASEGGSGGLCVAGGPR